MMRSAIIAKSLFLSTLLVGVNILALPIAKAGAWSVDHSAASICKDEEAVASWTFSNTEPNKPKWSIDLTVTDSQSKNQVSRTVAPGETVSGTFTSNQSTIGAGSIEFKMLWTDGRSGVDIRTSTYEASAECKTTVTEPEIPVEEPEEKAAFDAQIVCKVVNNKAQYILETKQTAGKKELQTTPANGTILSSGKAITVTGHYADDSKTIIVTKKTTEVKDCTPQMLSTATEKKTPTPKAPAVLPNTGAGSIVVLLAAVFVGGTSVSHLVQRKR